MGQDTHSPVPYYETSGNCQIWLKGDHMSRPPYYVNDVISRLDGEKATYDKATGKWLIIKETSVRVPGKANPQKVKKVIAEATPSGRKEFSEDGVSSEPELQPTIVDCVSYEYGASRVLWVRLTSSWKNFNGDYATAIFLDAIKKELPDSYLLRGKSFTLPDSGIHVAQRQKYLWEDYKEAGIELKDLMPLKSLSMRCYPDGRAEINPPTPEQASLLEKYKVSLV